MNSHFRLGEVYEKRGAIFEHGNSGVRREEVEISKSERNHKVERDSAGVGH